MRRLILSLAGFLVLFIFAQNFADAGPKKNNTQFSTQMPYKCHELKAVKVTQHSKDDIEYRFKGICTIKNADGNYQDVWVKSDSRWLANDYAAQERVTVMGPGGGVIELSMKCEDNPWTTAARCALLNFGNTTEFASLVAAFRVKQEQDMLGYPPVSRGAVGIDKILFMANNQQKVTINADHETMLLDEKTEEDYDEVVADDDADDDDEQPLQLNIMAQPQNELTPVSQEQNNHVEVNAEPMSAASNTSQSDASSDVITAMVEENSLDQDGNTFFNPTYKGMRLHYCKQRNKGCGMLAASQWCQMNGFKRAEKFQSANDIGRAVHIGNSIVCRSATCDGFHSITCKQ